MSRNDSPFVKTTSAFWWRKLSKQIIVNRSYMKPMECKNLTLRWFLKMVTLKSLVLSQTKDWYLISRVRIARNPLLFQSKRQQSTTWLQITETANIDQTVAKLFSFGTLINNVFEEADIQQFWQEERKKTPRTKPLLPCWQSRYVSSGVNSI